MSHLESSVALWLHLSLSHEWFVFFLCLAIGSLLYLELRRSPLLRSLLNRRRKGRILSEEARPQGFAPILGNIQGSGRLEARLDPISQARVVPMNGLISPPVSASVSEPTENVLAQPLSASRYHGNELLPIHKNKNTSSSLPGVISTPSRAGYRGYQIDPLIISSSSSISTTPTGRLSPESDGKTTVATPKPDELQQNLDQDTENIDDDTIGQIGVMIATPDPPHDIILEICRKISNPLPSGCEPTHPNVIALQRRFPGLLSTIDCVRFLVARKAVLRAAEEMIEKTIAWRSMNFPIKQNVIGAAISTGTFFPFGHAKDGSPIVIMRGCLYDSKIATPEQYVLAAAYVIDIALRTNPREVNVTVLVCTALIDGGANESADTNFIKLFISALSDNYPERLRRLAIFPFPWYGRVMWNVIKVFLDKRTQDKVMLCSGSSSGALPSEVKDFVDPQQIPRCIGGLNDSPLPTIPIPTPRP